MFKWSWLTKLLAKSPMLPVVDDGETKDLLDEVIDESEFYIDLGGYSNYTLHGSKNVYCVFETENVETLLMGLRTIKESIDSQRAALVKKAKIKLLSPREISLYHYMVTQAEYHVYPTQQLIMFIEHVMELANILKELREKEREGRFAYYMRLCTPLFNDYLALLRALRATPTFR